MTSREQDTSVDWFASLSVGELARSLWNYRISIVACTIGLTALLGVVVYYLPVKYDSDAQLLVRLGRNTLSADPTSNITPTVSVQETRLSQVSSVKEMLQSRALSEQIVKRVGADRILEPHGLVEESLKSLTQWILSRVRSGSRPGSAVDDGGLSPEEAQLHLKEEEAVAKLEDCIVVSTTKNAYTIHVRVRSGSPYLSRDVLSALLELYQIYHVNAYHSDGTLPFFERQTSSAYDTAVATKEKVRTAKDAMGVIEIESARVALREQLTQAHRELDQVSADLAATTSEVDRYEIEMKTLPERVQAETVTGITSNKSDGMRQQLYQLEVQVKELGSKLKEDHPQMRAIRDQLEAATAIAEKERKEQPQNRESLNPVFQQLELAYRSSLVRRDGLRAKRESLQQHLVALDEKIVELNRNELELTKLTWDSSLAENVYLQNAQNRDKARLIEALDREGLSEIAVVQPASLQLKKSSPKRGLLLVAAAMLACGIAVVQALARTVVSRSAQTDHARREVLADEEIDLAPRLITKNPREAVADEEVADEEERNYAYRVK